MNDRFKSIVRRRPFLSVAVAIAIAACSFAGFWYAAAVMTRDPLARRLFVEISWNAPAFRIDRDIASPLSREMLAVPGVRSVRTDCRSSFGLAVMTIEPSADVPEVFRLVEFKLARLAPLLPAPVLLRLSSIAGRTHQGDFHKHIEVRLHPCILARDTIPLADVLAAIDVGVGESPQAPAVDDFQNIRVGADAQGLPIRLKDIASVGPGPAFSPVAPVALDPRSAFLLDDGSAFAALIFADDLAGIEKISEEVRQKLAGMAGVRSASIDSSPAATRIDVRFDRAALASAGLTWREADAYVRAAVSGVIASGHSGATFDTGISLPDFDPVIVRFVPEDVDAVAEMETLPVVLPGGLVTPLSSLGQVFLNSSPSIIRRIDGRWVSRIRIDADPSRRSEIVDRVCLRLAPYLPPSARIEFAGIAASSSFLWPVSLAAAVLLILLFWLIRPRPAE